MGTNFSSYDILKIISCIRAVIINRVIKNSYLEKIKSEICIMMIIYGKMTVDLVVFISARDLSIPVYHKLQVVTFLFIF